MKRAISAEPEIVAREMMMQRKIWAAALVIWGVAAASRGAAPGIPLERLEVHPGWGIPGPVYLLSASPEVDESVPGKSGFGFLAETLAGSPPGPQDVLGDERFRLVDQALEEHTGSPLIAVPYRGQDRLYVGTASAIHVYDTTVPTDPQLLARVPGGAGDMVIHGGYLYALDAGGISTYDVTNPDLPVRLSHLPGLEGQRIVSERDLAIDQSDYGKLCAMVEVTLPVLGTLFFVQVADLSDPADPKLEYFVATSSLGGGLALWDNHGYVVHARAVHTVRFDEIYPAKVDLVLPPGGEPRDVFTPGVVEGQSTRYLYVGVDSGVVLYSIDEPSNPTELHYWEDLDCAGRALGRHMDYQLDERGERLYVENYRSSPHQFAIVDVSDKNEFVKLGGLPHLGGLLKPYVAGRQAYLAKSENLLVADLGDESAPVISSEIRVGYDLYGVAVADGGGAAAALDRFYHYDTSPGGIPGAVETRFMESDSVSRGKCFQVNRVGDAVFTTSLGLGGSTSAGACYDVSNPQDALQTGAFEGWSSSWQVAGETRIYGGKSALKIIDVSDPARPDSLGTLPFSGTVRRGAVSGGLLAVSSGSTRIDLIDVSDPSAPAEVGSVAPVRWTYVYEVALEGSLLVVEEHTNAGLQGLAFYDVTEPSAPIRISYLEWAVRGDITALELVEGRLYVAVDKGKIYVVDVRDPENLSWLGAYPAVGRSGMVNAMAVRGNELHVVGSGGLQMLRFLDLKVSLTPESEPVVVEPGNSFAYTAGIENVSAARRGGQVWIEAVLPDGTVYGPLLGPLPIELWPTEGAQQGLGQAIPSFAAPGEYKMQICTGTYPSVVRDQASFDFTVVEAAASPPDSLWGGTYGDGYRGNVFNVHATADGGFVVVGSVDRYERDIWLARLDAQGRTLWNQYYGNLGGENKADDGYDVQETADGGFLVGGSLYRVSGLHDAVMIRTDSEGVEQRRDVLASYASEKYSGITAMSDGRYVGAGDYGKAPELALLAYYTEAGVRQEMASIQCLEVPGGASVNDFRDVLGLPDGGLVAVGSAAGGTHKGWVVRTDAALNVIWENLFEIPTGVLTSVVATPDGGFAAAGYGFGSMVLVRMDADGNVLWEEYYEAGSAAEDLVALEDGFVLASTENDDAFLLRTDEDGLEVWTASYGGPSLDHLYTMDPAPGGGLVCGGRTRPEGFSGNYPWLFRLSAEK